MRLLTNGIQILSLKWPVSRILHNPTYGRTRHLIWHLSPLVSAARLARQSRRRSWRLSEVQIEKDGMLWWDCPMPVASGAAARVKSAPCAKHCPISHAAFYFLNFQKFYIYLSELLFPTRGNIQVINCVTIWFFMHRWARLILCVCSIKSFVISKKVSCSSCLTCSIPCSGKSLPLLILDSELCLLQNYQRRNYYSFIRAQLSQTCFSSTWQLWSPVRVVKPQKMYHC